MVSPGAMARRGEIDPEGELTKRAAIRDLVLGVALLGAGVVTGGSTLDGQADGLDYVFDSLALGWIAWALLRLVRRPKAS